jgi:hypothetical protein
MNVQLVEIFDKNEGNTERGQTYSVRTIYINPDHVVCIRESYDMLGLLSEGRLPQELDKRQEFTTLSLNKGTYGQDVVVIGSVNEIHKKLNTNHRQLLQG